MGVVQADMPFAWISCLCARSFLIRTLYVDLARFLNENLKFQVLRVTFALISDYNFQIMYLFLLVQVSPWPLECMEEAKMV